jgi:AcrR family transcriptional regulator
MAIESWRRLTAEERKTQLIELGGELFNSRRYSEISVDDIAQAAGISKGLLYHYFPSKEDFFLAGVERGAAQLLSACDPPRELPYVEQLALGIRGYLDYVERNSLGYLNLFRGETATLPGIQRVCEQTRAELGRRFLRGLGDAASTLAATRAAVRASQGFMEALVLDWLEHPALPRRQIELLAMTSTLTAIYSGLVCDLGPDSAELRALSAAAATSVAFLEREFGFKAWGLPR